jgi:hypothetical protein
MKLFLTLLFLFSFYFNSRANLDHSTSKKNSIYIELLGIGGYGSLNFQREFIQVKKVKIGFRLGLSTYNITDFTTQFNPDIIIPFAIHAQYGNKNNIELGLGQVITNIVETNPISFTPERTTAIHANFTIGYRYQKPEGGFIFRINYSPIIESYQAYKHWGGLSFGYAF